MLLIKAFINLIIDMSLQHLFEYLKIFIPSFLQNFLVLNYEDKNVIVLIAIYFMKVFYLTLQPIFINFTLLRFCFVLFQQFSLYIVLFYD